MVSTNFRRTLFAQDDDNGALLLVTLSHALLAQPIRVALNTENVISRGNTFIAYPFHITKPEVGSDRAPRARITIDNVDRQIAVAVRTIQTPLDVLIETVAFDDVNTVEESLDGFKLSNVQLNVTSVTGDLVLEDLSLSPYPYGRFTPGQFRGMF